MPADPRSSDSINIARTAYPRLDEARQRSVRLVISIPVLSLLIVLGAGTILYGVLKSYQGALISREAMALLEGRPELGKVRFEIAAAEGKLESAALLTLMLSIGLSLVSAVVGYILARQIVRPIKNLADTMEAIAEGDFSTKLEPIRLGELGQLGSTFNRMVEQLNKLFEERDRQLRESFKGAHLVLNEEGVVIQADQAVRRVFGLSPNELMDRHLIVRNNMIPVIDRNPRFLEALTDLLQQALVGRATHRSVMVRGDGLDAPKRYFLSCHPMQGGPGERTKVLLEVRDISGIASFYEQIQRADRLAAVGTLATGIAHEIRNPLASIRGMAQLLAEFSTDEHSDPATTSEYHQRIIREVDRLEKLVAGIMNFAQTQESPAEEVDLSKLLKEMVETASLHVGESCREIPVKWELDLALPKGNLQVEKLRQAFLNLTVNAYQHSRLMGRGPIRIHTAYAPSNAQRPLTICISNPGSPIDESLRERIFEPFYTTKPEGTGLGLPIAYHAILSNGGTMEVECSEGEIHFWIRLPRDISQRQSASRIIPRYNTPVPVRGDPSMDASW